MKHQAFTNTMTRYILITGKADMIDMIDKHRLNRSPQEASVKAPTRDQATSESFGSPSLIEYCPAKANIHFNSDSYNQPTPSKNTLFLQRKLHERTSERGTVYCCRRR
jgi:hypothetical protein